MTLLTILARLSRGSRRGLIAALLPLVLALALGGVPVAALAKNGDRRTNVATAPNTASIVIEAKTGRILHESNGNRLRHPASLTKMMTLYMAFQALETGKLGMNQYLPVSVTAAEQPPSKLGLRRGTRVRAEDVILGLVTESANDAAVVMGEWLGGSEEGFAKMMTAQARALGMSQTRFKNPSGLPDPEQVTTARDMAMLGHALIYHFPQYYPYFSQTSFNYGGVNHPNHNRLMRRYDGMDGIKTGYIRASGFNLVASAERNGVRLIGVVFGGRSAVSRDNKMAQLLDDAWDAVGRGTVPVASNAPARPSSAKPYQEPQGDAALETELTTASVEQTVEDADPEAEAKPVQKQRSVTSTPKQTQAAAKKARGWAVQIGSYQRADSGRAALAKASRALPDLLQGAKPVLDRVKARSGAVVYRARLTSLKQDDARAVCAAMIEDGKDCHVVRP